MSANILYELQAIQNYSLYFSLLYILTSFPCGVSLSFQGVHTMSADVCASLLNLLLLSTLHGLNKFYFIQMLIRCML